MKKQSKLSDELRPEYDMKSLLKGGVRGKYTARYRAGTNLVMKLKQVQEEAGGYVTRQEHQAP